MYKRQVIRCAALDKILKLKRQWERQVSLDYLMNEKFVQFAASERDEEYPFTVCGQTVPVSYTHLKIDPKHDTKRRNYPDELHPSAD